MCHIIKRINGIYHTRPGFVHAEEPLSPLRSAGYTFSTNKADSAGISLKVAGLNLELSGGKTPPHSSCKRNIADFFSLSRSVEERGGKKSIKANIREKVVQESENEGIKHQHAACTVETSGAHPRFELELRMLGAKRGENVKGNQVSYLEDIT